MSTLGAFLTAAAGPIARKVLTSLGVGTVTFVGLDLALGALIDQARTAYASNALSEVAAFMALAGVNTAVAMIAGTLTARVAMIALKRFEVL